MRDTPISEMGFLGAAVGAAVTGLRPVAELMFMDFIGVCLDPLLNQAAKLRYMFGGKARVPLTVRTSMGAGMRAAAQHSQTLYAITTAIPGLKTVCPSTPYDAKGLLLAAIRDDDPVVFCEPKSLHLHRRRGAGRRLRGAARQGAIVREGGDVTLVGIGRTTQRALEAAERARSRGHERRGPRPALAPAARRGGDPRRRSRRPAALVVVDEATPRCGIATDVAALCVDRGFDYLDAPGEARDGAARARAVQPGARGRVHADGGPSDRSGARDRIEDMPGTNPDRDAEARHDDARGHGRRVAGRRRRPGGEGAASS